MMVILSYSRCKIA